MYAAVAIDPTGRYVAVDDRKNYVRLWELATGQAVLSTEQHHQGGVIAAVWSADSTRIVTGSSAFYGEVRVWDAASGRPLTRFRGPEWGVYSVRYTPDESQLVLCGHEARQWNPARGGQVSGPVRWHDAQSGQLLRGVWLPARAQRLTLSPDSSLIAVLTHAVEIERADDSKVLSPPAVRLLDASSGKELGHVDLDPNGASAVCWSADGQTLFSVSGSKVIQIDSQTRKVITEVLLPHFREDPLTRLFEETFIFRAAFLRHSTGIVTAGALKEIYGWKLPSGEKEWTLKTDGYFGTIVLSPDDRLLAAHIPAADRSHELALFEVASQRLMTKIDLGRNPPMHAEFSPSGNRVLVGFEDGTALVYDISDVE
jgi:WD40 repeat protein